MGACIETQHLRTPARWFDQVQQQADGRGLTRAVGSQESEDHTGGNLDREVIQCPDRRKTAA